MLRASPTSIALFFPLRDSCMSQNPPFFSPLLVFHFQFISPSSSGFSIEPPHFFAFNSLFIDDDLVLLKRGVFLSIHFFFLVLFGRLSRPTSLFVRLKGSLVKRASFSSPKSLLSCHPAACLPASLDARFWVKVDGFHRVALVCAIRPLRLLIVLFGAVPTEPRVPLRLAGR